MTSHYNNKIVFLLTTVPVLLINYLFFDSTFQEQALLISYYQLYLVVVGRYRDCHILAFYCVYFRKALVLYFFFLLTIRYGDKCRVTYNESIAFVINALKFS